ncbi:MAG: YesL family protein [Roseburia inulinivorans]
MLQKDGKFVKVLNRIADLVGLNLLAILFCIPIITIGASITAVYGCIFRIQEKREGYLTKDFWKLFKECFRSSTIIYFVGVAVVAMLYLDYQIFATDSRLDILQVLVVAGGILVAEIFTYAFPMESYFENSLKATVKNALLLGISNIPYTLLMLGINVFPFFLVARIPVTFGIWFLIGISGVAWINSFFLKKIFSKVRIRKDV